MTAICYLCLCGRVPQFAHLNTNFFIETLLVTGSFETVHFAADIFDVKFLPPVLSAKETICRVNFLSRGILTLDMYPREILPPKPHARKIETNDNNN